MSAKSVGIAGLMALAGLALIAVIASNPFSTQASTHDTADGQETEERLSADVATPSQIAGPEQSDPLQGTDEDSDDSEPYIGVAIFELEDGTIKVVRVQKGSPSDGALMSGDVITAVDGTTVTGTSDLTDAIAEAGSGTAITLTITRDGSSQTVDVTIGERDTSVPSVRVYRSSKTFGPWRMGHPRLGMGKSDALSGVDGKPVHTRVVFEKEDGSYSTYRAVVGTVSDVDAAAGTFTLDPKDGSDSIDYTIGDDTKVVMGRSGDLGELNTDDDTLVVDIDGEVKMVQQGELPGKRGHLFRGGKRRGGVSMTDQNDMIQKALEAMRSTVDDRM